MTRVFPNLASPWWLLLLLALLLLPLDIGVRRLIASNVGVFVVVVVVFVVVVVGTVVPAGTSVRVGCAAVSPPAS